MATNYSDLISDVPDTITGTNGIKYNIIEGEAGKVYSYFIIRCFFSMLLVILVIFCGCFLYFFPFFISHSFDFLSDSINWILGYLWQSFRCQKWKKWIRCMQGIREDRRWRQLFKRSSEQSENSSRSDAPEPRSVLWFHRRPQTVLSIIGTLSKCGSSFN